MTSVTAPRDDLGLLRLRLANGAAELTGEIGQVRPYPAIQEETPAVDLDPYRRQGGAHADRRHPGERRQGQRRQDLAPTLLDTRDHHERRMQQRRRNDRGPVPQPLPDAPYPALGIDTYA